MTTHNPDDMPQCICPRKDGERVVVDSSTGPQMTRAANCPIHGDPKAAKTCPTCGQEWKEPR